MKRTEKQLRQLREAEVVHLKKAIREFVNIVEFDKQHQVKAWEMDCIIGWQGFFENKLKQIGG